MGTHLILALLLLSLGAFGGWWVTDTKADAILNAERLKHSHERERQTEQAIEADAKAQLEVAQKNAAMRALDHTKTQELEDARKETRRLRSCIDAGTCGVRIVTRVVATPSATQAPGDGTTTSVGDDSITLDRSVQQRVLDLRDAIDEDRAKLQYLQQYAERCSERAG